MFLQRIWLCFRKVFNRLTLRKRYQDLQEELAIRNDFKRTVTTIPMTVLGIGGIIGTGIYVLSGQGAAEYAGPSIIISFIIGGIVALLSALSLAEMASMMASSGSAYTYTYVALGEYPAFVIGWLSTLLYQLGASAVAVRWSHYVVHFIDLVSGHKASLSLVEAPVAWSDEQTAFYMTGAVLNLPAIAITIGISLLLIIGIRETTIMNFVFVVIKVVILLIFIFACCKYVDRKNYEPFFPTNQGSFNRYGVSGMFYTSTFVFFAYVGFESITTVAQEAKTPAKTVPLALILSLVISLLIYVGVSTVMVGLVPYKTLDTTYPLSASVQGTPFGSWLPILLSLGAIASLTTVGITVLLSQSRFFYAMAHDGLLPKIFGRLHHHTNTPWISIIISGVICAILSGVCPLDMLGEMASIAALIMYLVVHVCVIVMRYTHKEIAAPFRVPFGPWLVPISGIILCVLLLSNTTKGTGIRFGIWMGVGHIVYFSYGFWHSKARLQERRLLQDNVSEAPPVELSVMSYVFEEKKGMDDEEIIIIKL